MSSGGEIMEYKFKRSICDNTSFEVKKIEISDIELLKLHDFKNSDGTEYNLNHLLESYPNIISKEKDMFLKALGGGSFEIPEKYLFGHKGKIYYFEFGGGGNRASIYENLNNGSNNKRMEQSSWNNPKVSEEVQKEFAEAMAIREFQSPWLNECTISLNSYIHSLDTTMEKGSKEKTNKFINNIKQGKQSFLKRICKKIFK